MKPFDPIIFHELPVIQKIIEDETWLEGERRCCPVSSEDPVVRENVCLVLLRIGHQLRVSVAAAQRVRRRTVAARRRRSRIAA
jgi:hypothetical protein